MARPRKHSSKTKLLMRRIDSDRAEMGVNGMRALASDGDAIFPLDFLAIAAIKRNLSSSRALVTMVKSWNMLGARIILRTHLDTALRFSAAWLVNDPHDFALRVMAGEHIDKMVDATGAKLRDAHLVAIRSQEWPWLRAVYGNLSDYVHFSGAHVAASIFQLSEDAEARRVEFALSPTDEKFPAESWCEVLECCHEVNLMLAHYLRGYAMTKRMPPTELAQLREQRASDASTKL